MSLRAADFRQPGERAADAPRVAHPGKCGAGAFEGDAGQPGLPETPVRVPVLQQQLRIGAHDFIGQAVQVAVQDLDPSALDVIGGKDQDRARGRLVVLCGQVVDVGRFEFTLFFVMGAGSFFQALNQVRTFALQAVVQEIAAQVAVNRQLLGEDSTIVGDNDTVKVLPLLESVRLAASNKFDPPVISHDLWQLLNLPRPAEAEQEFAERQEKFQGLLAQAHAWGDPDLVTALEQ